jgi:hypothetical protein
MRAGEGKMRRRVYGWPARGVNDRTPAGRLPTRGATRFHATGCRSAFGRRHGGEVGPVGSGTGPVGAGRCGSLRRTTSAGRRRRESGSVACDGGWNSGRACWAAGNGACIGAACCRTGIPPLHPRRTSSPRPTFEQPIQHGAGRQPAPVPVLPEAVVDHRYLWTIDRPPAFEDPRRQVVASGSAGLFARPRWGRVGGPPAAANRASTRS